MKLLRVGTAGTETPALLDADGVLRDLSGVVDDIDGRLLADDAALGRVRAAAEAGELPALDATGSASGRRSPGSGRSSASGSTTTTTRARRGPSRPPSR